MLKMHANKGSHQHENIEYISTKRLRYSNKTVNNLIESGLCDIDQYTLIKQSFNFLCYILCISFTVLFKMKLHDNPYEKLHS